MQSIGPTKIQQRKRGRQRTGIFLRKLYNILDSMYVTYLPTYRLGG